jgi:hypothetical protein
MKRLLPCTLVLVVVAGGWSGLAQQPKPAPAVKKQLDHDAYDIWNTILDAKLSDNGQWLHYTLKNGKGDTTLVIRQTGADKQYAIARGTLARFSGDAKFAVYLIAPEKKEEDKAKDDDEDIPEDLLDQEVTKKPTPPTPKELGILDLGSGKITTIAKVTSYRLPDKGNWLAYFIEKEVKKPDDKKPEPKPEPETPEPKPGGKKPGSKTKAPPPKPGDVVLRNLDTGAETRFEDVTNYALGEDGQRLAFITTDKDGKKNGVDVVTTATGQRLTLLSGPGKFSALTLAESGDKLAFLSDRDDQKAKTPVLSLYYWQAGWKDAQALVKPGQGLPAGWGVVSGRQPSFSKSGQRLFFGAAPLPEEPKKSKTDKNLDKVKVDIWHWKDPLLQPMQLVQAAKDEQRTYLTLVQPDTGQIIPLETKDVPLPDRRPLRPAAESADQSADPCRAVARREIRDLVGWAQQGLDGPACQGPAND